MRLETSRWEAQLTRLQSSWFDDPGRFPEGTVVFDHALIMQNLPHRWRTVPDLVG